MEDIRKEVGESIKQIRAGKGLSQRELGRKMGVTGVTINGYETGLQNLTIQTLHKIAEALEVNLIIKFE